MQADDIALLQRAAALDWAEIDPSILGTLFERGLDPDKRSQLGAHYTSREMIERLVDPVVRQPLLAQWQEVRGRIADAMAGLSATRAGAMRAGARVGAKGRREAERQLRLFLDHLRAVRVLDPACGSGNFLYLALLALKDLEHQAMVEAEALGLQREFPAGRAGGGAGSGGEPLRGRAGPRVRLDRPYPMGAPPRIARPIGPSATHAGHYRLP